MASSDRLPRLPRLFTLVCLSAACGADGAAGARGAGETVLYASGADLQSINPLVTVHPLAKQVQKHVLFLTLAAYDSMVRPVPRLAEWTWSDGGRALTFHLRRDVRWHDGVPTTAADVQWTLEQARDPVVAYPRAGDLADVSDVRTPDAHTIVLRFARPQPTFPDVFTDLAILPAHHFAGVPSNGVRGAPFNAAPVGNGPFAFRDYRPNHRWVFERAPAFPEGLGRPRFERLVVAVVDEPTTKLAGLTSGELDFAGIHPAHARFVEDDPRLRVMDYPVLLAYGLVYNLRRAIFADERVRRALTRAIDRQLVVDAYLHGFGTVAEGPVNPDHPWHEPVPAEPHDPTGAARLLDAAGWRVGADGLRYRDGVSLRFDLLTVGSGDLALEQMLQAQLRRVGVGVGIRRLELSTFLDLAQGAARDFDALVTGIPGDLALSFVAAMFDGDGPLAYPGLDDGPLRRAFASVREAETAADLERAWRTVQRRLAERHPVTWVYHARGVQGVADRVRDVRIDLRGELAGIAHWTVGSGATDSTPLTALTAGGGRGRGQR